MTRARVTALVSLAMASLAVVPTVNAQSAIAGVVKDASGAVVPGVTVTASSDALIERTRSAVTDAAGQYKIVDLRPGVYSVVFTLQGMSTFKRDGVELPAAFTATINGEMKLGNLEETVTVSGESPVVDLSSTVHTQVLSRETLDAIPTGRSIQSLGQVVLGISLNIPDVGGSRAMQQTYMSTHGMTTSNTTVLVDGMMVNGLQGDGAIQSYFNDAMSQEVSYQTSGIAADTSAGGVRLNMIPKEGGNRFNGTFFASWRDGKWQGDNFTQDLKDRGLANPSAIDRIYDFNLSQGGPIKRDKLWFFVAARAWSVDAPIAGTFVSDGTPAGFGRCLRAPVSCEQGIDDQKIMSGMARLTWQMSPRHKLSGYFDQIEKYRGHAMVAGDDYHTASEVWHSPSYHTASLKWTTTLSSKLYLEAGYSRNFEFYTIDYQEGIAQPRGSAAWLAGASRSDLDLVARTRALASTVTQSPARHAALASVTYVTGSHNLKLGVQRTWGWFRHTRDANADLVQQYRSNATGIPFTVPNSVLARNTPYASQENLNYDWGLYAQDQWTYKRLTLNAGLRYELLNGEIPDQERVVGRFVPEARKIPGIKNLPNWKDFAPRLGLVYDAFGNGKTALKFSLNRYNRARTTGLAENYNALDNTTATLPWTDKNGDDVAQGAFRCNFADPACEINYAGLPANFGTAATARFDPNTRRPWNLESAFEIQQQVAKRVSVTASWFRGSFHDLGYRDNQNITKDDWTAAPVFNPITGAPLTIYSLNTNARGRAIDNLDTTATDRSEAYSSFTLQLNARLPHDIVVFGGAGMERYLVNSCDEPDDPNQLRFCDDANLPEGFKIPYQKQAKLGMSVPLTWGIQLSGVFQSIQGTPVRRNGQTRAVGGTSWLLSTTTRYPANCPAPCPAGALVLPTVSGPPGSANLTVKLIPYGAKGEFNDRINQLDLRLTKSVTLGRLRVSPQLDVFNVFNASSVILMRSVNFATATYNQPSGILNGRIIGLGMQMRW